MVCIPTLSELRVSCAEPLAMLPWPICVPPSYRRGQRLVLGCRSLQHQEHPPHRHRRDHRALVELGLRQGVDAALQNNTNVVVNRLGNARDGLRLRGAQTAGTAVPRTNERLRQASNLRIMAVLLVEAATLRASEVRPASHAVLRMIGSKRRRSRNRRSEHSGVRQIR